MNGFRDPLLDPSGQLPRFPEKLRERLLERLRDLLRGCLFIRPLPSEPMSGCGDPQPDSVFFEDGDGGVVRLEAGLSTTRPLGISKCSVLAMIQTSPSPVHLFLACIHSL